MGARRTHIIMRTYICITTLALLLVASDALPAQETAISAVVPETEFEEATPACTVAFLKSVKDSGKTGSCIESAKKGGLRHIQFAVTVPSHCTSSKRCGVIVNTHGQGMNGKAMEGSTGVAAAALKGEKFIVLAPEDADSNWEFHTTMAQESDDASLINHFVSTTIRTFKDIVDKNHVHAMGFSQGGLMTAELLCKFSKQYCSTSLVAMPPTFELSPPGQYLNLPSCFNTALGGKGPQVERSMMFQMNTNKDPYFFGCPDKGVGVFKRSVASVKALYGMKGAGEKLSKGPGVDWTRYKNKAGITFEAAAYDFTSTPITHLGGHCIPFKGVKLTGLDTGMKCGNKKADGFVSGYTWSMETIKFFKAHPCK